MPSGSLLIAGDPQRIKEEKKMEPKRKRGVFAPRNPIAGKQLQKEDFSASVFNNIVKKSREGDVGAVRWLAAG